MTNPGAEVFRRFLERMERLGEEIKALKGDVREIEAEAKGLGFDVKIMRRVLKFRATDPRRREEDEAIFQLYLALSGDLGSDGLSSAARRRFAEAAVAAASPDGGEAGADAAGAEAGDSLPGTEEAPEAPEERRRAALEAGGEAARAGVPITANPYVAGDPRRAAWDEGWCLASGSDGMEIPAAFRRPKKSDAEPAAPAEPADEAGGASAPEESAGEEAAPAPGPEPESPPPEPEKKAAAKRGGGRRGRKGDGAESGAAAGGVA